MTTDILAGREPHPNGPFANAVAPTLSDTADDPAGVGQALVCTGVAGDVKVTLASGVVLTLPIDVGLEKAMPLRVQRVWSTGTTATGLMLLYV